MLIEDGTINGRYLPHRYCIYSKNDVLVSHATKVEIMVEYPNKLQITVKIFNEIPL